MTEKSLVLASIRGNIVFAAVGKQMRRLFGSRGGAARRDAVVSVESDSSAEEESGRAEWLARRKAKNKKEFREEGGGRCEKR